MQLNCLDSYFLLIRKISGQVNFYLKLLSQMTNIPKHYLVPFNFLPSLVGKVASVSIGWVCYDRSFNTCIVYCYQAMESAETNDRVHLRTTYYSFAKHLEEKGDVNGAIPKYDD